jgi:hypothetical protein
MPYVDRPLPASLELPQLRPSRPRDKRLDNLRHDGRVKGVQNRICRDLKEGLLQGAILHGYDGQGQGGLIGFCLHLAERHKKAYCGLLGKLLPYNLNATTSAQTISTVRVLSVPSGEYLSREAIQKIQQGDPLIEGAITSAPIVPERERAAPEPAPIEARTDMSEWTGLSPEELKRKALALIAEVSAALEEAD